MTQDVAVAIQDGIQTIHVNCAAKKNAQARVMYDTMTAALKSGDADPDVAVHVLMGSDGVFSAGNRRDHGADHAQGRSHRRTPWRAGSQGRRSRLSGKAAA